MAPPDQDPSPSKKFPDHIPPTKIHYDGAKPTTLHLRKCKILTTVG